MTWLRLQWRGALVALAAWAGLAAAKSPTAPQGSPYLPAVLPGPAPVPPGSPYLPSVPQLPPASAAAKRDAAADSLGRGRPSKSIAVTPTAAAAPAMPEHIVTVHENGMSIRCRIIQTWRLTDGTIAHQLQALDTGEYITIVDDPVAPMPHSRGLAKRIFHWGHRNRMPPAGTPLPPEWMMDSGVVIAGSPTQAPCGADRGRWAMPPVCAGAIVSVESGPVQGQVTVAPPPAPTLRDRLHNLFMAKSAPPAETDVKIIAPSPLRARTARSSSPRRRRRRRSCCRRRRPRRAWP